MSLFAELSDEAIAILKAAGHAVETFAMTEAGKVVHLFLNTDAATTLLNLISLESSKTASGAEKMAGVVSATVHLGEEFIAAGGFAGVFAKAEHLVQAAAQLVYDDFAADLAKVKAG